MSALTWAAIPVIAGVLTTHAAPAAANDPAPPPPPAPTPAPAATDPTPEPATPATPEPEPAPNAPMYVTTITTTTTTINAPIIVVAAPITTNLNTTTTSGPDGRPLRERVMIDLTGCGRPATPAEPRDPDGTARVRLARDATLVVRVNRKPVATLRLPSNARHRALRLRLAPDGRLSIHRPSGRVLAVQGCTPA